MPASPTAARPGVFAMQYGPGAENAFPGIATTFSDSVPVLFLPLGHAREQAQVFPMFHSSRTYASVTKQVEHILVPEQVPAAMRRAFSQLKNGRPGPVMVELPRDVLELDIGSDTLDHTAGARRRARARRRMTSRRPRVCWSMHRAR